MTVCVWLQSLYFFYYTILSVIHIQQDSKYGGEVYISLFSACGSGLTPICDTYRKGNLESESNFPGVFFIAWKDLLLTPF